MDPHRGRLLHGSRANAVQFADTLAGLLGSEIVKGVPDRVSRPT